ncbi:MAG: sulfurtransferase complex subunit TusD, partial [Gammaproteobacteria bacterium]|nr:sulfurtransferase complex subunit TusD [Gammaproteobacteria bacterium]
MRIALLIQGAPRTTDAPVAALKFARAALAAGHAIHRAFFHKDGVCIANRFVALPADEPDIAAEWLEFAERHDVELTVCIAASARRGVLDAGEAARAGRTGATLGEGLEVDRLGQIIEERRAADRH